MKSIVVLVLGGFLWVLAVPYLYSVTDDDATHLEYFVTAGHEAEEENVESFSDLEKELKHRLAFTDSHLSSGEYKICFHSAEARFDHRFMEIPNPPPEGAKPLV